MQAEKGRAARPRWPVGSHDLDRLFSASDQRLGGVQGPTLASPLRTRAPASLRALHERGPEVGAEPVWSVMVCRLLLARPGCQVVFRAAPGHPTTTLPC